MQGVIKTAEQLELMRLSAALLARCLDMLVSCAQPGTTGKYLDSIAEEFMRDHGAIPAFKNYAIKAAPSPFPASICFSVNEVVVHGIPTANPINEGDIITIDCGLSLNGWFADAARLFSVGETAPEDLKLIESSEKALEAGILMCKSGNRLGDISHAIQKSIGESRYFNVPEFCGHAIGTQMHETPQVPNFGSPEKGLLLEEGMVFCLEPVLKQTKTRLGVFPDGWTIKTLDNSRAAHIEHMVLVTNQGPEILTE